MKFASILRAKPPPRRHPIAADTYDSEQVSQPVQKLVICAPPRTASTYLTALLRTAGLSVPEEYFGLPIERDIRARTDLPKTMSKYRTDRAYFNKIVELRTHDGLFAVKLQYWQLQRLARCGMSGDLFDGAKVVFLTRDNLIDQAISQAVAVLSQRWGDNPDIGRKTLNPTDRQLRRAYTRALRFILWENLSFERFFATTGIEPHRLRTTDITGQPMVQVEYIAGLVGRQLQNGNELADLIRIGQRHSVDADIKRRMRQEIVPSLPGFELLEKRSGPTSVFNIAQRTIVDFVFRRNGRIS